MRNDSGISPQGDHSAQTWPHQSACSLTVCRWTSCNPASLPGGITSPPISVQVNHNQHLSHNIQHIWMTCRKQPFRIPAPVTPVSSNSPCHNQDIVSCATNFMWLGGSFVWQPGKTRADSFKQSPFPYIPFMHRIPFEATENPFPKTEMTTIRLFLCEPRLSLQLSQLVPFSLSDLFSKLPHSTFLGGLFQRWVFSKSKWLQSKACTKEKFSQLQQSLSSMTDLFFLHVFNIVYLSHLSQLGDKHEVGIAFIPVFLQYFK